MKDVRFLGSSLDDIKNFPAGARREAGFELSNVQSGLQPSDWKPMSTVGSGAGEIRIKDEAGIYRVVYVAKFEEAVYVLHAFEKKTRKTSKADIALARSLSDLGRFYCGGGRTAQMSPIFRCVGPLCASKSRPFVLALPLASLRTPKSDRLLGLDLKITLHSIAS